MGVASFLLHLILLQFCIYFCKGTVWKTEDAYIIDDIIDDPKEVSGKVVPSESTNVCVDSTGAQGRCIPIEECSPFYNFISNKTLQPQLANIQDLQRLLNSTEDQCTPDLDEVTTTTEEIPLTNRPNYVCCTSVEYANVRTSSWDEYLLQNPNKPSKDPIPQIPQAVYNSSGSQAGTYIVSGSGTRIGEFPYAVAILYNGKQFCGGSLLDSQWVLTAAHCFDRFTSAKVSRLVVSVGDHDLSTNYEVQHQESYVSKLFLHPAFFRARDYFMSDVALVKLRNPIYGYSHVSTVALHTGAPNINQGGVQAEVVGWGRTCAANDCPQSSTLLKTTLQVISNAECTRMLQGTAAPPISQGMVCAWDSSGRDACYGDSGGPLVIHDNYGQTYQIGIVSFGISCGQYPGVFTRVSSYINWVQKHKNRG